MHRLKKISLPVFVHSLPWGLWIERKLLLVRSSQGETLMAVGSHQQGSLGEMAQSRPNWLSCLACRFYDLQSRISNKIHSEPRKRNFIGVVHKLRHHFRKQRGLWNDNGWWHHHFLLLFDCKFEVPFLKKGRFKLKVRISAIISMKKSDYFKILDIYEN